MHIRVSPFSLLSLGVLALAALICYHMVSWWSWSDCDGAPYLYVSYHHKIKGVRKYSRNGCFLSANILDKRVNEARSVTIGTYLGRDALYVCEARQSMNKSHLMVYGECDESGKRPFLKNVASEAKNPGINHPYGLTFDPSGNIYASNQHTDVVLRFEKDTFKPLPYPDWLQKQINKSKISPTLLFPGTFFGYTFSDTHKKKQGIRDVEFVHDQLWVANEDIAGISIVSLDGEEVERIDMPNHAKPIGVHFNREYDVVFVSTKSSYGAVYAFSPSSKKIQKIYYHEGMTHSTGLISYGNILYVAAQDMGKILAFDIDSGGFTAEVVRHFPDTVEQISLSWC